MTGRRPACKANGIVIAPRLGRRGRHARSVTTTLKRITMYVYILYSESILRYYVGQTADIESRLLRHNKGYVKSTKRGLPWRLIYKIEVHSRSEALILEGKIKKRGAKRYFDNQFGV